MNKLFLVKVFTGLVSVSHISETVNAKTENEAKKLACIKSKKNLFSMGYVPPYTVALDAVIIGGD